MGERVSQRIKSYQTSSGHSRWREENTLTGTALWVSELSLQCSQMPGQNLWPLFSNIRATDKANPQKTGLLHQTYLVLSFANFLIFFIYMYIYVYKTASAVHHFFLHNTTIASNCIQPVHRSFQEGRKKGWRDISSIRIYLVFHSFLSTSHREMSPLTSENHPFLCIGHQQTVVYRKKCNF